MLESKFQNDIIEDLREMFPGCVILKNDANYLQGIPDLSIFHGGKYGFLEVKPFFPKKSDYQPNQEYYIELFNEWSFGAMICPENQEEVYREIQQAFRTGR